MASVLSIQDLSVDYGHFRALRQMSMEVGRGEIVGIAGPNGAGKSTLLASVAGVVKPSAGALELGGRSVWCTTGKQRYSARDAVRAGVVLVPEGRRLFADLSVEDNLRFGAYTAGRRAKGTALDEVYDLFPKLRERRTQSAGTLSGGEQQMVAIARALMTQPSLLLIDELSLGLAPVIARRIYDALRSFAASSELTMVLVDETLKYLSAAASRIVFLSHGDKIAEELTEDLTDSRAAELYLGVSSGEPPGI